MKEPGVHADRTFVSNHQTAEVLKPRVRPFHDPSLPIATQLSPVLMSRVRAIRLRWNDRFNTSTRQPPSQRVAIVGLVHDQSIRKHPRSTGPIRTPYLDVAERRLEEPDLGRGRRVQVNSERSTLAIDQNHKLCSLAPLGLADARAPFFAEAKVPSAKHSSHRIRCRSFRSARNDRHISRRTSDSSHSLSRRQQVVALPYASGSAAHGAPVQRIHRTPSKHRRSSTRGLPPRGRFGAFGRWGAIFSHCRSVKPFHAMTHLHTPQELHSGYPTPDRQVLK